MLSHEITSIVGPNTQRKRIGRGTGSGRGKTSGRGHKGSLSRAGRIHKLGYEGGSMPLFRRLPKRGFNNAAFAKKYEIINVSQLNRFDEGAVIDAVALFTAGLLNDANSKVKLLGDGELTKKFDVNVHKFSKSAQEKILSCGGAVRVVV